MAHGKLSAGAGEAVSDTKKPLLLSLTHKGPLVIGMLKRNLSDNWRCVDVCYQRQQKFKQEGHELDGVVITVEAPHVVLAAVKQAIDRLNESYEKDDVRGIVLEANLNWSKTTRFSNVAPSLGLLKQTYPNIRRVLCVTGDASDEDMMIHIAENEYNRVTKAPCRINQKQIAWMGELDKEKLTSFFQGENVAMSEQFYSLAQVQRWYSRKPKTSTSAVSEAAGTAALSVDVTSSSGEDRSRPRSTTAVSYGRQRRRRKMYEMVNQPSSDASGARSERPLWLLDIMKPDTKKDEAGAGAGQSAGSGSRQMPGTRAGRLSSTATVSDHTTASSKTATTTVAAPSVSSTTAGTPVSNNVAGTLPKISAETTANTATTTPLAGDDKPGDEKPSQPPATAVVAAADGGASLPPAADDANAETCGGCMTFFRGVLNLGTRQVTPASTEPT